jgi:predicted HD phosphohydrolase
MATATRADFGRLVLALVRAKDQNDGEEVDLLTHGLQTAAILHRQEPSDVELHLAGLVHDIGTVLWPNRPKTHARSGASFVEPLLGPRVAWLVAHHQEAKRYLVAVDPDYVHHLSPHSIDTLSVQGGPLSQRECARLRAEPLIDRLLMLRRADDRAKAPGRQVPGLEQWLPVLEAVMNAQVAPGAG